MIINDIYVIFMFNNNFIRYF